MMAAQSRACSAPTAIMPIKATTTGSADTGSTWTSSNLRLGCMPISRAWPAPPTANSPNSAFPGARESSGFTLRFAAFALSLCQEPPECAVAAKAMERSCARSSSSKALSTWASTRWPQRSRFTAMAATTSSWIKTNRENVAWRVAILDLDHWRTGDLRVGHQLLRAGPPALRGLQRHATDCSGLNARAQSL